MLEILQTICSVLVWVACPLLILLILVQGGAGDVSSAFGGGGQLDSALGVGANKKLAQVTGWISVGFLVSIIILAIPVEGSLGEDSIIPEAPVTQSLSGADGDVVTPTPATPATTAAVVDPEPMIITPSATPAATVTPAATTEVTPTATAEVSSVDFLGAPE